MIQVVCFSHKRPLQLHGYLSSLLAHWHPAPRVSVLARVAEPYRTAYEEVASEFQDVEFRAEQAFAQDLRDLLDPDIEFVCFGCDDVVYVEPVLTDSLPEVFDGISSLIGLSLRLGRNVQRDMFDRPMPMPSVAETGAFGLPGLVWPATSGPASDWTWAFDTLGTVYRTGFVLDLLDAVGDVPNPSQLEEQANHVWRHCTAAQHLCAYRTSRLVVPTVNVVQTEFPGNGIRGARALAPEFLLECWRNGLRLDWQRYNGMVPSSWRVPEFYLTRTVAA